METVADSRMTGRGTPQHNPADSFACSELKAQLKLEQRLLKSKDGSVDVRVKSMQSEKFDK